MGKHFWIIFGLIILLVSISWFAYQQIINDVDEKFIIEEYGGIPLFYGLKSDNHKYVIKGNYCEEIYDFYLKELRKYGWEIEYDYSIYNNNDTNNDWKGFISRWTKAGFGSELWVLTNYNQLEKQTEVIFDITNIKATKWIVEVPESVCIFKNSTDNECTQIQEKNKIIEIVYHINNAVDFYGEILPRDNISIIDFGENKIEIFYGGDKEIYLKSEMSKKIMKPDPSFLKFINLSQ